MTSPSRGPPITDENNLRAKAIKRIKQRRDFRGQVIFLIVNTAIGLSGRQSRAETYHRRPARVTGIWLFIILVIDAFKVYGERPISDQHVNVYGPNLEPVAASTRREP